MYFDYFGMLVVLLISDEEGDVIDGVCYVVWLFVECG